MPQQYRKDEKQSKLHRGNIRQRRRRKRARRNHTKNTNQPDTTEQKRPLRNQIENKREIPELHNRYRISRNHNAKQPNNVRTDGYSTAARKIPRREQKRD